MPVKWSPGQIASREGGSRTLGVGLSGGGAGRGRILLMDARASGVAR